MKFTEALERVSKDHEIYFEAQDKDLDDYQLWGDEDGAYVFLLQGLVNIGIPWFVFELDWKEVKV